MGHFEDHVVFYIIITSVLSLLGCLGRICANSQNKKHADMNITMGFATGDRVKARAKLQLRTGRKQVIATRGMQGTVISYDGGRVAKIQFDNGEAHTINIGCVNKVSSGVHVGNAMGNPVQATPRAYGSNSVYAMQQSLMYAPPVSPAYQPMQNQAYAPPVMQVREVVRWHLSPSKEPECGTSVPI
jgi:hypothetical protein